MRKHEYKHVEKYNVDYRPLTHTEFTPDADFIKGDVYLYQREYLFILALLESKISIPVNCSSTVKNVRKE